METLAFGAGVFLPGLLAKCIQDRLDCGGALGRQVAADGSRAAERRADLDVAVIEAVVFIRVRVLRLPLGQGASQDHSQIVQGRAGRGGLDEDLLDSEDRFGVLAQLAGQVLDPLQDLVRPGRGDVAAGQRFFQWRVLRKDAHLADRSLRVWRRHAAHRC